MSKQPNGALADLDPLQWLDATTAAYFFSLFGEQQHTHHNRLLALQVDTLADAPERYKRYSYPGLAVATGQKPTITHLPPRSIVIYVQRKFAANISPNTPAAWFSRGLIDRIKPTHGFPLYKLKDIDCLFETAKVINSDGKVDVDGLPCETIPSASRRSGFSEAVLHKWRQHCPLLGKPLPVIEVLARQPQRPHAPNYLHDHFLVISSAVIDNLIELKAENDDAYKTIPEIISLTRQGNTSVSKRINKHRIPNKQVYREYNSRAPMLITGYHLKKYLAARDADNAAALARLGLNYEWADETPVSAKQIAEQRGIKEGTVNSKLNRWRNDLKPAERKSAVIEVPDANPKLGEAKFLYRWGAVKGLFGCG